MSNKSLSAFMRPNVQQIENAKYAASALDHVVEDLRALVDGHGKGQHQCVGLVKAVLVVVNGLNVVNAMAQLYMSVIIQ